MSNSLNTLVVHHRPVDEIVYKRLLLIFDKVWMLNPIENLDMVPDNVALIKYSNMTIGMAGYGVFYNGDLYKEKEERLITKLDYAYNKDILKVVDLRARKFFLKHWLPLRLSYDFDTGNKELLSKCRKLLEINSHAKIGGSGMIRGLFISPSGVKIYPDIPPEVNIFDDEDNKKYHFNIQAYSVIGKINRALAVCGEYNLIPTFIDSNITDIFRAKSALAIGNPDPSIGKSFFNSNNYEIHNVQHLLFKISEILVPNEILREIPIKDLLIARNNTFHELQKLRRKLISNVHFLANHQFDVSFDKEVNEYIANEIVPNLYEYSSKFKSLFQKFIKHGSVFATGAATASYSFIPGIDPMGIAVLSGISATVGNAVSNLPSIVSRKKKKEFSNTYSYFLNYKE